MTLPVRNLPVIQNWDCHVCGTCCKEYLVTVSDEERRRIEGQGWEQDPAIADLPLFRTSGPPWRRRYHLNHRPDGSCIFLSPEGRCRIHEKHGYEAKPLPCRMFPFVLVPAGDHWRVGMRFACPSAAENKGRQVPQHEDALKKFAAELVRREGFDRQPGGPQFAVPRLQGRQEIDWPDLLRFAGVLAELLRNRRDRMERRWRKCLALAALCRQARFDTIKGDRLSEFLGILTGTLDAQVPAEPGSVPPPTWVGRVLFRQAAALFTRKDHGPNRGLAREGRLKLLWAAWRFARGTGVVPRMNWKMPEATFEAIEARPAALTPDAEDVLERYYTLKVDSLQFCGSTNFDLPVWEGLEVLALTFPIVLWVTRACGDLPRAEAVARALTIVDDHFGYNPVLNSGRQRVSFRLLSRGGELPKLIAWYGR